MTNPPKTPSMPQSDIREILNILIMQYDQKLKIGNKRNLEAIDRATQAIERLITNHTNTAKIQLMDDIEAGNIPYFEGVVIPKKLNAAVIAELEDLLMYMPEYSDAEELVENRLATLKKQRDTL